MNEAEKRSNFLGLILLFVIFTPLGIVLSYFYVMFQSNIHDIWANIIATFVMGGVLAVIVWILKRMLKVTNNAMAFAVITVSMIIVMYLMWSMWITLIYERFIFEREFRVFGDIGEFIAATRVLIFNHHSPGRIAEFTADLRFINENGTWHINNNVWTGLRLGAVWVGETVVIAGLPLIAAFAAAGLFIAELNAWVEERLMNFGFAAFDDYELDRIASGDIDAIIEKPLEARNGPMNAIAVCYLKDEPTDFIAIYKASWDKEGALSKGRHIMTVQLGQEKIDALDSGLQAKHFPTPTPKAASTETTPDPQAQPGETENLWRNVHAEVENTPSQPEADASLDAAADAASDTGADSGGE